MPSGDEAILLTRGTGIDCIIGAVSVNLPSASLQLEGLFTAL